VTRRTLAPGAVNGQGAAAPEGATQAPWERLAELHAELCRCYGDLARQAQNQVAAGSEQSDITRVKLLTASDLAERLSVDVRTIRRWRTDGRLPGALEVGGCIRWRREDIDAWIAGEVT
jgi:excisionase family DNA binding protein